MNRALFLSTVRITVTRSNKEGITRTLHARCHSILMKNKRQYGVYFSYRDADFSNFLQTKTYAIRLIWKMLQKNLYMVALSYSSQTYSFRCKTLGTSFTFMCMLSLFTYSISVHPINKPAYPVQSCGRLKPIPANIGRKTSNQSYSSITHTDLRSVYLQCKSIFPCLSV